MRRREPRRGGGVRARHRAEFQRRRSAGGRCDPRAIADGAAARRSRAGASGRSRRHRRLSAPCSATASRGAVDRTAAADDRCERLETLHSGRGLATPELTQARAQFAAARADVGVARRGSAAARSPTPSIKDSIRPRCRPEEIRQHRGTLATANLDMPIFDWGATRARSARRSCARRVPSCSRQIADSRSLSAVRHRAPGGDDRGRRVDNARRAVADAERNVDISIARYRAGEAPIPEVTDAQTTLAQQRWQLQQALYDFRSPAPICRRPPENDNLSRRRKDDSADGAGRGGASAACRSAPPSLLVASRRFGWCWHRRSAALTKRRNIDRQRAGGESGAGADRATAHDRSPRSRARQRSHAQSENQRADRADGICSRTASFIAATSWRCSNRAISPRSVPRPRRRCAKRRSASRITRERRHSADERAGRQKAVRDAQGRSTTRARPYERRKTLYEQGGISKKDLEASQLDVTKAEDDLRLAETSASLHHRHDQPVRPRRRAKQSAAGARSIWQRFRRRLGYATIRAPFDGVVTEQFLFQGDFASAGTKMLTIADTSTSSSRAPLSDRRRDARACRRCRHGPARRAARRHAVRERSSLVGRAADPQSRSVEVWISLPNPDGTAAPQRRRARHRQQRRRRRTPIVVPTVRGHARRDERATAGTVMVVDAQIGRARSAKSPPARTAANGRRSPPGFTAARRSSSKATTACRTERRCRTRADARNRPPRGNGLNEPRPRRLDAVARRAARHRAAVHRRPRGAGARPALALSADRLPANHHRRRERRRAGAADARLRDQADRRGDERHPRHRAHQIDDGARRDARSISSSTGRPTSCRRCRSCRRACRSSPRRCRRARRSTRVERLTFAVFPILGYSITSPKRDPGTLRNLAEVTLRPPLARIDGVASVHGAAADSCASITCCVDPARLEARGALAAAGRRRREERERHRRRRD